MNNSIQISAALEYMNANRYESAESNAPDWWKYIWSCEHLFTWLKNNQVCKVAAIRHELW